MVPSILPNHKKTAGTFTHHHAGRIDRARVRKELNPEFRHDRLARAIHLADSRPPIPTDVRRRTRLVHSRLLHPPDQIILSIEGGPGLELPQYAPLDLSF